jgi:hypothetical protein
MQLLKIIAIISLIVLLVSACIVVIDVRSGHRQKMAIMNWGWPITALWAGPFGLWAYYPVGRGRRTPERLWLTAANGDPHCAAGCTLGDFAGECSVFLSAFTIAGSVLWSDYLIDLLLAPTKADTISLVSFEVGMLAWMALTHEVLSRQPLKRTEPAYWFMMQIAMGAGFLTAWPASSWLIRRGLKEAM